MITRSPKPCSEPASTGRTGQHRGSPARPTCNAGSLVSSAGTIRNTSIARSGSSPPMPDTPARTTNSSLVAPSSTPKPAPPTPRAGHVRSETGRRLATVASTPSATPAATKSETPADRHRTTPLTNTGPVLEGLQHLARVVPFVGHHLGRDLGARRRLNRGQVP